MSDETEMSVSLKEYFESKFADLDKANNTAYRAMDRRLESMNEFRDALKDQAARFVTRSDLEALKSGVDADIRVLREYKSLLEGKASQSSVVVAWILSGLSLAVGIVGIAIRLSAR